MTKRERRLRPLPVSKRKLLVGSVLTGLVVLFIVIDLIVAAVAQVQLRQAVTAALPEARVTARVGGWPVSLHLLRDQLGSVDVEASDIGLAAQGRDLHVTRLKAKAHGVHGVVSGGEVRIDRIEGTAKLTWSELSQVTGADLGLAENGQVRVSGKVPVLGERLDGELTGTLVLERDSQQLRLSEPWGRLGGVVVPQDVLSGLISKLSSRFTLPTVPGLVWTGVEADADGVTLSFEGQNLLFAR